MRLSDSTRRRALFLGFLACLAVTSSMGFAQRPAIDQKTSAKESVVKEQGRLLDAPRGVIEVLDNGPAHGEPIILLPSLGRGAGLQRSDAPIICSGLSRPAAATPRNRPVGSSCGTANIGRACR